MNGQPKPAFYAAVVLVVLALVAFAVYRSDIFAPAPDKKKSGSDSDVRLDLHPKASAHDPDAALPTEEIALDLSGPGSSTVLKGPGSSGKLSAPKSGVNFAGNVFMM